MSVVVNRPSHQLVLCDLHNAGISYEKAEDLEKATDDECAKYDRLV